MNKLSHFEKYLSVVIEGLPDWHWSGRRRAFKDKQSGRTQQEQPQPQQPQPQTQTQTKTVTKTEVRLPAESAKMYQQYKQNIVKSLGIIARLIPDLKDDIQNALDFLFRNVTTNIQFEAVGEGWDVLQQEWLNVLNNIDAIRDIIPATSEYAGLRNNVRSFRNHLKMTVGKFIFNKPAGATKHTTLSGKPL